MPVFKRNREEDPEVQYGKVPIGAAQQMMPRAPSMGSAMGAGDVPPVDLNTGAPMGGLEGIDLFDMPQQVIGKKELSEAMQTMKDYKAAKANLEARIVGNEQWYKIRHWETIRNKSHNPGDPEPASAWLLNTILNKHADAMDNYPKPVILPREEGDKQDAKILSSILPVIREQNNYEQTYSDVWWYKLKSGTGVTGVFWDQGKNNGLGDIDIRKIDLLNIFWEPGITDIQDSRNVFSIALVDNDLIYDQYPEMKTRLGGTGIDIAKYIYEDTVDTTKKSILVDWYYKKKVNGRDILHYCKFIFGVNEPLFATENDPQYAERGWYDHGKYPFVFDTMFPVEGSPCGFGYVDICKSPQIYVDKLDQALLKHAVMGSRPRFFIRGDGSINEKEYADWTKDFVHFAGSGNPQDNVFPIQIPDISGSYINIRDAKVNEMKETSGNRDFQQGGTAAGVSAASAIAALQEAGSKLSRDMIKSAYRADALISNLCIELIRQFYEESRFFRIIGERGAMEFVAFSGQQIRAKPQGDAFGVDLGYRVPIFDIQVKAEKSSPFSTEAQNERAKELYQLGFFRPDLSDQSLAALDMMQFEGIDQVRQRIAQNGTLFQQVQQLQQQVMQLAQIVDATQGSSLMQAMGSNGAMMQDASQQPAGGTPEERKGSLAEQARERAASQASPQ